MDRDLSFTLVDKLPKSSPNATAGFAGRRTGRDELELPASYELICCGSEEMGQMLV
jgi:hypothetical protein